MRWPPFWVVPLVLHSPGGLQHEPMIFAPRLLASSMPNPVRFPDGFIPTRKMDMPMALGPSRPKRSSHGSDPPPPFKAVLKPNPWMFWRMLAVCTVTPLTSTSVPPLLSVVSLTVELVSPAVVLVASPLPVLVPVNVSTAVVPVTVLAPVVPVDDPLLVAVTVLAPVVPVTVLVPFAPVTVLAPVVPVTVLVPFAPVTVLAPVVPVAVLVTPFVPVVVALSDVFAPLPPPVVSEHAAAARKPTLAAREYVPKFRLIPTAKSLRLVGCSANTGFWKPVLAGLQEPVSFSNALARGNRKLALASAPLLLSAPSRRSGTSSDYSRRDVVDAHTVVVATSTRIVGTMLLGPMNEPDMGAMASGCRCTATAT